MDNNEKVVRDGKVAIVYSPGFGAGWSTWASMDGMEFEPKVVEWVENGKNRDEYEKLETYLQDKYNYVYTGGLSDCVIEWVTQGTPYRIDEYDGSESLTTDISDWDVA